jgi:phage protein D
VPGYVVRVIKQGQKNAEPIDRSEEVTNFVYDDIEKGADKLSLTVDNFDLRNFDNPTWEIGNRLLVTWGYEGNMAPERKLVIKNVNGFQVLTIEALEEAVLLNQQRKTRSFEQTKYSDIAHAIAIEAGYSEDYLRKIDDSKIIHEVVSQNGLSDAQLLRNMANKIGWEWYLDWDGFHFHPKRLGQRPLRKFIFYLDPNQGEVLSVNFDISTTAKPQGTTGAVKVTGRDPIEKKDINETADKTTEKGRDTLGDVTKVVDPKSGSTAYKVPSASETLVTSSAANAEQAKQEAQGKFAQAQTKQVKMTAKVVGDPNLFAKSITLWEFPGAKSITGPYYLIGVKHTLSAGGDSYSSEITARRNAMTGTGAAGQTKAGGKTNTKEAADSPIDLVPQKTVDARDGSTQTVYTKGARE